MTDACRELRDRGSWCRLFWPLAVVAAVAALLAPSSAAGAQGSDETVAAFTTTYKDVSAGGKHSCGLSTSGTITCWGNNDDGQVDAPSGSFKAVSVGEEHSCGLSTGGTITCWGYNDDEQTNEPSGSFKALSSGNYHICGLSTSGTITCWGWNSNGQTGAPSGSFKAVSAGLRHSCALSTSDTISCWGYNNNGQTNAPSGSFKAVSAGNFHSCALSTSGTISCWGYNGEGRANSPSGSFKAVSAGSQHSCGLSTGGTISCWGSNADGQTNAPSGSFKAVSAGAKHSCGLSTSGTISCWGNDAHGQSDPLSGSTSVSVPGKVGRPSVTAGDGSLTVSWTAPDDGGSAIIGYYVGYGEHGSTSSSATRLGVTTSWTITGLTNGVVYRVSVQAINAAGTGLSSDSVLATPQSSATRPDPVRQISVTPGDRSLTVSWTAPGDGGSRITGYEVSYIESQYVGCAQCGNEVWEITTTARRATLTGLTNGTSYAVYVRARNSVGVGLWVTYASGTPVASATVPGKVGRPSVTVGDGSLTVSWSAPSNGGSAITGYEVWYSPDTSSQSWTRTTTSTSVTLSSLTNGTSYSIHVRAQNAQGFGSWSDASPGTPMSSATRPGIVAQPSVSVGDGSLAASWSAPSNGGSAITGYDVRYIETTYVGCGDCGVSPTTLTTTSRQVRITGLTNGTSYTVSVRAKNSVGSGLWSSNASGTPVASATVPGKVGRPSVTVGDGSLTVSWSAPSDGGSSITGYDVQAISTDGTHSVTRGASAGARQATVPGLTNGRTYNVSVRAINSVGSGSWSDSVSATPVAAVTVPGKVGRPSVTVGDGSLTVSWSAPSDGGSSITGYEVWYSPDTSSQSWTRTTTSTSVTLSGLTNGLNYTVYVRAQNAQGFGGWSDAAWGTPVSSATVPGKVGQLSITASDGSLSVSWNVPSDGGSAITGFDVWYSSSSSGDTWTRSTTAARVTLSNLTNGTSYRVNVRANNSQGQGSWSDAAWGTPVAAAAVPAKVGLPSVSAGDGSLTVSWWPPSDGGAAITDYDVRYIESSYIGCADCGALPWVDWQSSAVSTTPWTRITGLANGTSYAVVVRAKNSVGTGPWSDGGHGTPVAAASVPRQVAPPTAVVGDGSLTVSWSPPDDGGAAITGYDVWYRPNTSSGSYTELHTTATSITIPNLTNGTSYRVFVRAENSVGEGAWSEGVWATPTSGASVPDKPALPTVVAGNGSLTVSWSPPDDGGSVITGYEIWYRPSTSSGSYTALNTTATSITISGLTNGISYDVFVRAQNAEGVGEWSVRSSGTPLSEGSVPAKPSRPSVVAGNRSLMVSWSPPADGGSAITLYEVLYRPDTSSQSRVHRTTETRATLSSLTNGTSYTILVRAQNAQGFSDWSDGASGIPKVIKAPSEPILTVTQNGSTVTVRWVVKNNGGAPIIYHPLYYRISSLPFDSDFRIGNADREKIREDEDCLVSASFTTFTNHTATSSDGNAVLRFDPPCNRHLESRFFRTLEFRVAVRNSTNRWVWSTPQRLTLMPWTKPIGKLEIRSATIQDGDLADWLKRSRDVHVVFRDDEIWRESHYRVEWLIADEFTSCDAAANTERINETDPKRIDDYYNVGRYSHSSRVIAVHDVGRDPTNYCFRAVASNGLGKIRSEWLKSAPALTSAQAEVLDTCSTIDQQEVISEEMHDILKTVVLARHTASWATGARFGTFMRNAGRLAKGLSWSAIAISIIDELARCNFDLGAFLRNVPVIKEIVDGYENNLYADIANCAGLDLDHFFECADRN